VDISESKVACTLRFFEEGGRGLVAGPFEAVLHLFEHHYHPLLLPFWYGAAEVGWDTPGFLKAFGKTPVYRQVVRVELADGRRGRAIAFAGFGDQQSAGPLLVIGLVGISALPPPAATPEGVSRAPQAPAAVRGGRGLPEAVGRRGGAAMAGRPRQPSGPRPGGRPGGKSVAIVPLRS
jgi:hypothetical protein